MDDWSGGAVAPQLGTYGSLLLFGGGHGGDLGNEVYRFDVATGLWSRFTEPPQPATCNFSTSQMPNGGPCADHTYANLQYSPVTNEFIKLGGSAYDTGYTGTGYVYALNLATRTWRRGAHQPNWAAGGAGGAASAWDPSATCFGGTARPTPTD